MIESVRGLIVAGSAEEAELIVAELRRAGLPVQSENIDSEESFRASIAGGWDIILADYSLPGLSALKALEILRETGILTPLIVISRPIGEEAAAECIKQGAADFLLKTNLARLGTAVREALLQRKLREEQRQSGNLEVAAQMATGVGHEFNNLLTVINGYSSILVRHPQLPAGVKNKLQEIDDAGRRAAQLTGQLLVFARKHIRQPGVLDLNSVISGMTPLLKSLLGEGIELRLKLQPDLALVYADLGEIEQVVINLAANGRDAMANSGILEIETSALETEPSAVISVTDHGCGMNAETQSRIFEPFFSTKDSAKGSGAGMGLSIAYGIAKGLGGRILVATAIGQGSTFRVVLPSFDAIRGVSHGESAPSFRTLEAPPSRRETVLVVENEDQLRKLIVSILQPHGYRVIEARNAAEAIDICGADGNLIDVLLTDVQMPHMTGIELAAMIQESHPQVRTIYMSGHDALEIAAKTPGAAFLPKPFSPKALVGKVREALDSSSSAPLVLVVDDDPQIRNLLRSVLGEAGYRVEHAADGKQALEHMNLRKTPDLLIADLIMPEVEGIETITRMRRIVPRLKIIAMSGSMEDIYLDTARVLGANATFPKPLQLDALLAAVHDLLKPNAKTTAS